ncbi:hypothetical protein BDF22DRAFT_693637 [Syncephalis plumigaleata]|nr:hypothetical protein BDF22DRAFT_693637 [Syncephalis plumigaleata]
MSTSLLQPLLLRVATSFILLLSLQVHCQDSHCLKDTLLHCHLYCYCYITHSQEETHTYKMMSDGQLTAFCNLLGATVVFLIILYHFISVNAKTKQG